MGHLRDNSSPSPTPNPIDELSAVSQATFTRCIDKVTNKISNSPTQKRARHLVYLADAILHHFLLALGHQSL